MPNINFNNNNSARLSSNVPNLTGSLSNSVIQVNSGADMSNYYDKEEVDGLLENKSDIDHDHYYKVGLVEMGFQSTIRAIMTELGRKTDQTDVKKLISENAAPIDHEHEEYLTEHQDISGKADITYVDNAINTALGNVEQELDEIIGEVE